MTPDAHAYIQGYADCLARVFRVLEDRAEEGAEMTVKRYFAHAFASRNAYTEADFRMAKVPESTMKIIRPFIGHRVRTSSLF